MLRFSIVAYMNHVYNTHMKVLNVKILQKYMPLLHQSVTMKIVYLTYLLLVLANLIICVAVYVGLRSVNLLV